MIKVRPLEGVESIYAAQALHKLIYGIKCMPEYIAEDYNSFLSRVDLMDDAGKERIIRDALHFVRLEPEEAMDVLKFALDPNGIPYGDNNISHLKPADFDDVLTAVLMQVAREHNIRILSESEKKNLKNSQSISGRSLQDTHPSH